MAKRIVYTRPDSGVSLILPAPTAMRALQNGGGLMRLSQRNYEIAKFVAGGVLEAAAVTWVDGMIGGGHVEASFYAALRDKDIAPDGYDPDVLAQAPIDREFRNAWMRPQGGGPIGIDIAKARGIQSARIVAAQAHAVLQLESDRQHALIEGRSADAAKLASDKAAAVALDLTALSAVIQNAQNVNALRAIWPTELVRFKEV